MTPEQVRLVQTTFEKIRPVAQETGELFYQKFFEMDPTVRPLFKGDMKQQGLMLMTAIGMAVSNIDRPETIAGNIEALGRRHWNYGVRAADYNTFGAALMWTLEQVLGDAFTQEAREAWGETFALLSENMKRATTQ